MTTMRNPKNSVVLHVYKWLLQLFMDVDTFQQNYINFTLIFMLCSHGTRLIFDQLKICAFRCTVCTEPHYLYKNLDV